ncbi:acyltransferase domain-containing protein [Streptomyces coeruleorubidus]|uniref:acyltransferase domain-containing protein n=1 Tax=Streptomyces coeruleorubidus TaxID=116188 RepID=UPI00237F44AB|nr:acyltransferase domain-containing protein [Streptomyces coeruleorubidus]WDV49080.1 acyltransferase domain-containing protein [Streptomyces coeruleorubidus]
MAFQFTGQGGHHPGMASALYARFPAARQVLDTCEQHYRDLTGDSLLAALCTEDSGEAPLGDTDIAQPALFALQCALVRLWRDCGVEPQAVTGHSVGEYAALYAAGALSLEDGLRLTTERGRLMRQRCAPGAMVAAPLDRASALALAAEIPGLEPAVSNGDRAQVLAGPVAAVERACELLDDRGTPGHRLPVTRAFHTASMEPMLEEFRKTLDDADFRPVLLPFVSALDGVTRPPGWIPDADHFLRHTREPVRFDQALHGIGAEQPDVLLEIGPHTTLSGLARRALPDVRALPSLRRGTGLGALWGAAAGLHCAGADVAWETLLAGSGGRRIPLPGYRFQHQDHWTGPEPTALNRGTSASKGAEVVQQEAAVARVLHSIVDATARHLGGDPSAIVGDANFFELGADSLQMISVLRELEQEHQVKVTMRQLLEETGTPRRLAEFIVARMPNAGTGSAEAVGERSGAPEPAAQPPAVAMQAGAPQAPAPAVPEPAIALSAPTPATTPAPAPAPEYATREELEDLAHKIQQMSRIQLQMMSQLSQLLALQTASVTERLNGKVAK